MPEKRQKKNIELIIISLFFVIYKSGTHWIFIPIYFHRSNCLSYLSHSMKCLSCASSFDFTQSCTYVTNTLYRILLDFRLPIIPHNILNTPLYFFTFIHSHILSISFFLGRLSSTQIYKISIKCVQLFISCLKLKFILQLR